MSFYELDLIEASSDGQLVLTPSPFGQKGVSFPLVELAPGHAVFANAAHDWPREIEYRLTPEGDLYTRVSGVQNGQPSTLAYTQKKGR